MHQKTVDLVKKLRLPHTSVIPVRDKSEVNAFQSAKEAQSHQLKSLRYQYCTGSPSEKLNIYNIQDLQIMPRQTILKASLGVLSAQSGAEADKKHGSSQYLGCLISDLAQYESAYLWSMLTSTWTVPASSPQVSKIYLISQLGFMHTFLWLSLPTLVPKSCNLNAQQGTIWDSSAFVSLCNQYDKVVWGVKHDERTARTCTFGREFGTFLDGLEGYTRMEHAHALNVFLPTFLHLSASYPDLQSLLSWSLTISQFSTWRNYI